MVPASPRSPGRRLVGDGVVVCPLHARTFDLASGEALQGEVGIATYPARLDEQGLICLELPADAPLPCTVDADADAEQLTS